MHQSIRMRFTKKGALRFISHQDTMRVLERAIRRSGLPIKMSEGFNPKPQLSYLLALGVGIESEAEVFILHLQEWTRTREIIERLNSQLPEGAQILDAQVVPPKYKVMASQVEYTVYATDTDAVSQEQIDTLLSKDNVPIDRIRKGKHKTVNIRPFIRTVYQEGDQLRMLFDVTATGTTNPLEVLGALGAEKQSIQSGMRIVRTQLN